MPKRSAIFQEGHIQRTMVQIATCILLLLFSGRFMALSAPREMYRWTDENGVVHLTDNVEKIPEKYRGRAEVVPLPPDRPKKEPPPVDPAPFLFEEQTDEAGRGKEWWQAEQKRWEERRRHAGGRIDALNQELRELQFRHPLTGPPVDERDRIEQEIAFEEDKKREADRMLNEVLPEKARKAGVSPGWLR